MGLATFVALAPHFAAAKTVPVPPLKPSREEFREFCRYYREQGRKSKSTARIPRPKIGSGVAFVPVAAVEAGQNRFSFIRLTAALKKLSKLENLDNDKARNAGYIAAYDHGRSFFPKYRKTTGLYYRGKVYILDGHHRALLSTYLGAETMPMEIIADWSHLDPDAFLVEMYNHGYSYFLNYMGEPQNPLDLCDLLDDPYLALARELLLRVDIQVKVIKLKKKAKNKGAMPKYKIKILDRRGSSLPIAIKINRDIPFLEFEIADRLRRAGVQWNSADTLTPEIEQKFLEILNQRNDSERFAQVLLLEYPTFVEELDNEQLEKMLLNHINRVRCEHQLAPGDAD